MSPCTRDLVVVKLCEYGNYATTNRALEKSSQDNVLRSLHIALDEHPLVWECEEECGDVNGRNSPPRATTKGCASCQ